ncbi:MAG: glutathione binding-like protein [Alphaproteobacteria bacterium]|nr:glutathione binding-like protein [Alphaproteobacteria bacterium]
MIDFHTWTTPNGRKIAIMLEEAHLDYIAHPVNISRGEQFSADFVKLSPNSKIPAIVDRDGPGGALAVFESGAILIYLAEKTGLFLPTDTAGRSLTLQWLFWQVGGFGPMLGQFGHFRVRNEDGDAYARTRYTEEAARLFGVLDRRLSESEFVGGAYSIADMAIYPWSAPVRARVAEAAGKQFPNVERWEKTIAERPAVGRGMGVPAV